MTTFSFRTVPASALRRPQPAVTAFSARIAKAIEGTRSFAVVYEDTLGEGVGAWHEGARYPDGRVNCLTWLQLVLAEAYGARNGAAGKQLAMDCLRYFGGQVGFSTRKHYLEHWLAFDPGPLRPISLGGLGNSHLFQTRLEPEILRHRRDFDAPLRHSDARTVDIEYVDAFSLGNASRGLPPGFYILFAVPTTSFGERFGDRCGPLGLVHSAFLELGPISHPNLPTARRVVHHASIVSGTVESVALEDYLLASVTIHRGYVVCALDPAWLPRVAEWTEDALRLVRRERQFEAGGFRPYLGF